MKTIIQTLIIFIFCCSCRQGAKQQEKEVQVTNTSQSESVVTEKEDTPINKNKVGKELFKSILDTITINNVDVKLLINNQWINRRVGSCESFLKFQENGSGVIYSCEMEEEYEITYKIEDNKVLIAEYDIPHIDNPEHKKIKHRDDTYIYNGHSLVMVNSKMFNIGGRVWIPEIEVVIDYKRESTNHNKTYKQ